MRLRTKQTDEANKLRLAESNSRIFSEVASELMGIEQDADADFERLRLHVGVLCFDEININDPFTALALKGGCPHWHTVSKHSAVSKSLTSRALSELEYHILEDSNLLKRANKASVSDSRRPQKFLPCPGKSDSVTA